MKPSISAIAIGFFLGFVVPFAAVMVIGLALAPTEGGPAQRPFPLYSVIWLVTAFAAPVLAGFLAARAAGVQPLLHGSLVGALAAILATVAATPAVVAAFVFIPGGIAGGWLWKVRGRKNAEDVHR